MKILVTGGAGFIGSHLVDAIIARGDEAMVIDHHKKEKRRFPNPAAKVYRIPFGDPSVRDILLAERPDAICHLAAQISVPASVEDPIFDAQMNIVDSLALLDASREAGVKKFVFAQSGGAIYGDHDILPTPELYDSRPISPYGVSKFALERYLESYHVLHGLPYASLRLANVYGPRQMMSGEGEGGVIAIFLSRLLSGEGVTINGDGSATRDFIYVGDVVDAFVRAVDSDFVGEANISTGMETSILELWKMLQSLHENEVRMAFGPERTGDIKRSVLDSRFAKEVIGWEARTSFEDGLRKTYEWFRGLE